MPTNQVIQRQHVIDAMNNQFINKVGYTWHKGNLPGGHADANQFDSALPARPTVNNISAGVITASTLTNNLNAIANWYTNVRNCRYVETYTYTGDNPRVVTTVDIQNIALLNTGYRQNYTGSNATGSAGSLIYDPNITNVYNRWVAYRGNTVTLTYNTHTQHQNHSKRSRR